MEPSSAHAQHFQRKCRQRLSYHLVIGLPTRNRSSFLHIRKRDRPALCVYCSRTLVTSPGSLVELYLSKEREPPDLFSMCLAELSTKPLQASTLLAWPGDRCRCTVLLRPDSLPNICGGTGVDLRNWTVSPRCSCAAFLTCSLGGRQLRSRLPDDQERGTHTHIHNY